MNKMVINNYIFVLVENCLHSQYLKLRAMKNIAKIIATAVLIAISAFAFSQSIVNIQPDEGHQGDTLRIGIAGNNTQFNQGSSTITFRNDDGVVLNTYNVNILSATTMEMDMYISIAAPAGFYDLIYNNWFGSQIVVQDGFFVDFPQGIERPGSQKLKVRFQSFSTSSDQYKVSIESGLNEKAINTLIFNVYDLSGRKLLEKEFSGKSFLLNTSRFSANHFLIYSLKSENQILSTGRFMLLNRQ